MSDPQDQIKPLPLTPDQQAQAFDRIAEQRKLLDDEFEATAKFEQERESAGQSLIDDEPFRSDSRVAVDIALMADSVKSIDDKLDNIATAILQLAAALEGRGQ